MTTMTNTVLILAFSGCGLPTSEPIPYYSGGAAPVAASISPSSESGNIGGGTATISGSGFGDGADAVLVQFGDHSAEILAVSDGSIEVRVPPGSMSGGDARVRVGTRGGYSNVPTGYRYDLDVGAGEGGDQDGERNEVGYVQVNNYWESCLGGLSDRYSSACLSISYIGTSGLDGRAELLEFAYPRLHSPNIGWWLTGGAADLGTDEWAVQRNVDGAFAFGIDNLRVSLGDVYLTNAALSGKGVEYCADLDSTAVYRYGGGVDGFDDAYTYQDASVPAEIVGEDTCKNAYRRDTLDFCQRLPIDGVPTYTYGPDWPLIADFFADGKGGRNDTLDPVTVEFNATGAGLNAVEIKLPPNLVIYNTEGFADVAGEEAAAGQGWSAFSAPTHCFDDDGNGEKLDDVAFRFEWERAPKDSTTVPDGDVLAVRTYVRMTLTAISVGWFGPIGQPTRATITVPDEHEYDKSTKRSSIAVPASVLYQFPSTNPPGGGQFGLGEYDPNAGYFVIAFERVTEYALRGHKGDVVFSYTTGDFGLFDWTNPTEDACHNCLDDDDDGWSDDTDPDCGGGPEELGDGEGACNDGVDNDDDGDADAADSGCEDGLDAEE